MLHKRNYIYSYYVDSHFDAMMADNTTTNGDANTSNANGNADANDDTVIDRRVEQAGYGYPSYYTRDDSDDGDEYKDTTIEKPYEQVLQYLYEHEINEIKKNKHDIKRLLSNWQLKRQRGRSIRREARLNRRKEIEREQIQVYYGPAKDLVDDAERRYHSELHTNRRLKQQIEELKKRLNKLEEKQKLSDNSTYKHGPLQVLQYVIPLDNIREVSLLPQLVADEENKDMNHTAKAIYEGILHSRPTVLRGNMDRLAITGKIKRKIKQNRDGSSSDDDDDDSSSDDSGEGDDDNEIKPNPVVFFTDLSDLKKVYGKLELNISQLKFGSESKPPFEAIPMTLKKFIDCGRGNDNEWFSEMHYLQQIELDMFDGKYFRYCVFLQVDNRDLFCRFCSL